MNSATNPSLLVDKCQTKPSATNVAIKPRLSIYCKLVKNGMIFS
jgi:hypothetical protein